jgi:hypothetical protein
MTPLYLKDALLSIAAAEYQAEVSSATFEPSTSTATWKGLTPEAVFTQTANATWVITIVWAQDWDDATSLGVYLFQNEGEEVELVFEPKTGGAGFSATVVITPGAIGGAVDGFAESTVSLPVQGKPAYVPPVAARKARAKAGADAAAS